MKKIILFLFVLASSFANAQVATSFITPSGDTVNIYTKSDTITEDERTVTGHSILKGFLKFQGMSEFIVDSVNYLNLIAKHGIKLETNTSKLEIDNYNMTVTDNSSHKEGLKYAGDYEAEFAPRTLVTKQYVDAHAGGLRRDPVADQPALVALTPGRFEIRQVDDSKNIYVFETTPHLTAEQIADANNISDAAGTGKWILQPTGVLVNFDYQLGQIVHAIPDPSKAIYEVNGQTVTDAKLATFITKNPITGFSVSGNNVTLPDWRGRYLGASGGRAISATPGAVMGSTNKRHRHYMWTDWHSRSGTPQTGTIIGEANANTNNTHEGTPPTTYEGSTYARPETAGMPICIIGGRSILLSGVSDQTRLSSDSILIYMQGATEVGRDTIKINGSNGGLRKSPVADQPALVALTPGRFEIRQVDDSKNIYVFETTPHLTAAQIADANNVSDAAGTGKWLLQANTVNSPANDEIYVTNIKEGDGEVVVTFSANPRTILLFGNGFSDYNAGVTLSFPDLQNSGTIKGALSGRNDVDVATSNSSEIFHILYEIRYISATSVGITTMRGGYTEGANDWANRSYGIEKVITRYGGTGTAASDGVVSAAAVTGTATKTLTLSRTEGLADVVTTWTDAGGNYDTNIISGDYQIANTYPTDYFKHFKNAAAVDVTVTVDGGTIDGAASYVMKPNEGAYMWHHGAGDWQVWASDKLGGYWTKTGDDLSYDSGDVRIGDRFQFLRNTANSSASLIGANVNWTGTQSTNAVYVFGGTGALPHNIGTGVYLLNILGGYDNTITNDTYASSMIGTHHSNISGSHNLIAGGSYLDILHDGNYCAVVGGTNNKINEANVSSHANYSLTFGGDGNRVNEHHSSIIGGASSIVNAHDAIIIGSSSSSIDALSSYSGVYSSSHSSIDDSGGNKSIYATIFGGYGGSITNGDYSTTVGGLHSSIDGRFSIVLGGRNNAVVGEYNIAGGRLAKINASGSICFSDNQGVELHNNTNNFFLSRYQNGYMFNGGNVAIESSLKVGVRGDGTPDPSLVTAAADGTFHEIAKSSFLQPTIKDNDGDTQIQTDEPGTDEDILRFDVDGVERMTIQNDATNTVDITGLINTNRLQLKPMHGGAAIAKTGYLEYDETSSNGVNNGVVRYVDEGSGFQNLAIVNATVQKSDWTSYVPTLEGVALGNGLNTAKYKVVEGPTNKTLYINGRLYLGTSGGDVTAKVFIHLPPGYTRLDGNINNVGVVSMTDNPAPNNHGTGTAMMWDDDKFFVILQQSGSNVIDEWSDTHIAEGTASSGYISVYYNLTIPIN